MSDSTLTRATEMVEAWRAGTSWPDLALAYDVTIRQAKAAIQVMTTPEERANRRADAVARGQQRFTDEHLLDLLRACAADLGRTPGSATFDRWAGSFTAQLLLMRFGSWREACEMVGLTPHPKPPGWGEPRFTEADHLAAYTRIKGIAGEVTVAVWQRLAIPGEEPGEGSLRRRYGNWREFRHAMERLAA